MPLNEMESNDRELVKRLLRDGKLNAYDIKDLEAEIERERPYNTFELEKDIADVLRLRKDEEREVYLSKEIDLYRKFLEKANARAIKNPDEMIQMLLDGLEWRETIALEGERYWDTAEEG